MSRPDRYSQYLIIDRIQTVISSINGYYESTDKPICRSQNHLWSKTNGSSITTWDHGILKKLHGHFIGINS